MACSCGRKRTQRTLFDVPSDSPYARQRRGESGEFHMASITQPTQFCVEFVVLWSFEKIKRERWKLVEGVGTKYLDRFGFCFWLCRWFIVYIAVNYFVSTVYFSLWKMGTLVLIASTYSFGCDDVTLTRGWEIHCKVPYRCYIKLHLVPYIKIYYFDKNKHIEKNHDFQISCF